MHKIIERKYEIFDKIKNKKLLYKINVYEKFQTAVTFMIVS